FLQDSQNLAKMFVKIFDLIGIVQQILPDRIRIRPKGIYRVALFYMFSCQFTHCTKCIRPMRFQATYPRAKRLSALLVFHKFAEIGSVVDGRNTRRRRRQLVSVKRWTEQLTALAI